MSIENTSADVSWLFGKLGLELILILVSVQFDSLEPYLISAEVSANLIQLLYIYLS